MYGESLFTGALPGGQKLQSGSRHMRGIVCRSRTWAGRPAVG